MTTDSNSSYSLSLASAQSTVETILTELATQDLAPLAALAFGDDYNRAALEQLQTQWLDGDFSLFPELEILAGADLNGASGAFSSETNTIYLSQDFLGLSSADALADLLLEEFGHYLDSQVSTVDSPGDEGAIFSALVREVELSATDLAVLRAEDDSSSITLDGIEIDVEQQVIGTDTRELITDTTEQPWSGIGWISSEWDRAGQSGDIFGATGSLFLSPYHVLTAAHAVWDKAEYEASGNGYASNITVNFGQSGQERFFGTANVTNMVTFNSWTEDSNWRLNNSGDWVAQSRRGDVALLTLDRSIGDYVGYFEHGADISPNSEIEVAGYPADLAESWSWQHGSSVAASLAPDIDLYRDSGTISGVSNGVLSYQLDTAGGQSGAPILSYDPETSNNQIVGVHVAGSASSNFGVELTDGKVNAIAAEIANSTAPEDLPDLIDYDFWFGTDSASFTNNSTDTSSRNGATLTINPGDDFTVRSLVRNNGTASSALPTTVAFYASVDSEINSEDYLLGEVSLGEITPFAYQEAIASASLPDLAAGDYYIGWEIDSGRDIAEFIESNNAGLLNDFILTVE